MEKAIEPPEDRETFELYAAAIPKLLAHSKIEYEAVILIYSIDMENDKMHMISMATNKNHQYPST